MRGNRIPVQSPVDFVLLYKEMIIKDMADTNTAEQIS